MFPLPLPKSSFESIAAATRREDMTDLYEILSELQSLYNTPVILIFSIFIFAVYDIIFPLRNLSGTQAWKKICSQLYQKYNFLKMYGYILKKNKNDDTKNVLPINILN